MDVKRIGTVLVYLGTAGLMWDLVAFSLLFFKIIDIHLSLYGVDLPTLLISFIILFGVVGITGSILRGEEEWEPGEGETVLWNNKEYERLSNEDKKKYLEWKAKIQAKIEAKDKLRSIKRK